jgi:hypothetical protein
MPPQLARGLWLKRQSRRKHSERPLVETLPRIDIGDLCRWRVFPKDWHKAHLLELPFRYPFLKNLVISLEDIEANHVLGYTQVIKLRWCATGFGGLNRPRPLFICTMCSRSVTKLYFKGGYLNCRRCCNGTYASRVLGKYTRPVLQAIRLHNLLQFKTYMSKRNRNRLKARIPVTARHELNSKRVSHHSIQLPSTALAVQWVGADSGVLGTLLMVSLR